MENIRLCKLREPLLLIEVSAAVGCLLFMDSILPSTVAFDNTDNDENQEKEGNGQHHANKPATVSERDNGGSGEGEARALFTAMCAAVRLPDIFTTSKPLVLM
ncbi:hypothetical protein E2C01_001010 [Portunus trituberculatus]|uniref:Uncharacterized protein n=1 Tax=Portunus trituberculatus TaxID=210409 RepID=A0A5B7CI99_PORTR|nr:hypothetical protein [Portunus trituberculatus]